MDAAYYWKSRKDEARMKGILYRMKEKGTAKKETKQKELNKF